MSGFVLAAFTMQSMRSPLTMALFIHVFEGAVAFQVHQNAHIRKVKFQTFWGHSPQSPSEGRLTPLPIPHPLTPTHFKTFGLATAY